MRKFLMVPTAIAQLPINRTHQMLLSDIANFDKYYKTRDNIAEEMNLSPNYISKIISNLEREGYIEVCQTWGAKRCVRLAPELKQKIMEEISMKKSKKAQEDDDNVLDLSKNCVVKSVENVENFPHDMENIAQNVENFPHYNNKQLRQEKQNNYCLHDKTNENIKESSMSNIDLDSLDNSSLSVMVYQKFREFCPNTRRATPTLSKRLKVIAKFRMEFTPSEILLAAENLAKMKPLEFGNGPGADKWRANYSWLLNPQSLLSEEVFDKRIDWLERGVNDEVEPDMMIVGIDKWNKWKEEHGRKTVL